MSDISCIFCHFCRTHLAVSDISCIFLSFLSDISGSVGHILIIIIINNKSIYIAPNQSRLLSGALQNMAN